MGRFDKASRRRRALAKEVPRLLVPGRRRIACSAFKPYPLGGYEGQWSPHAAVRDRPEPRGSWERLLKECYKGEGVVRAHLSRKRQTFGADVATLKGNLADDTSKRALAFVTYGIALYRPGRRSSVLFEPREEASEDP